MEAKFHHEAIAPTIIKMATSFETDLDEAIFERFSEILFRGVPFRPLYNEEFSTTIHKIIFQTKKLDKYYADPFDFKLASSKYSNDKLRELNVLMELFSDFFENGMREKIGDELCNMLFTKENINTIMNTKNRALADCIDEILNTEVRKMCEK